MRNLQMRTWRFNELKKDLEGISQKVLTDSLRSMEKDGIVVRTVYAEVPTRVEYSLSELGKSMHPITDAFPALALGMEKGEADIMKRKPRSSNEGIFAGGMGFDCAYQQMVNKQ